MCGCGMIFHPSMFDYQRVIEVMWGSLYVCEFDSQQHDEVFGLSWNSGKDILESWGYRLSTSFNIFQHSHSHWSRLACWPSGPTGRGLMSGAGRAWLIAIAAMAVQPWAIPFRSLIEVSPYSGNSKEFLIFQVPLTTPQNKKKIWDVWFCKVRSSLCPHDIQILGESSQRIVPLAPWHPGSSPKASGPRRCWSWRRWWNKATVPFGHWWGLECTGWLGNLWRFPWPWGGIQKWLVYVMENPSINGWWLGVPLWRNGKLHICRIGLTNLTNL